MSVQQPHLLNPQDARLFRITHIDNVPWLLDQGLRCQSASLADPNFVAIGMQSLIDRRRNHPVPILPGGVLADYVPFYFTPWSMMLMNIRTGYNGIVKRANDEIVILGTKLPSLAKRGLKVIFTDGHAYMAQTKFFDDAARLDRIDWQILRNRSFAKSEDDPDRSRRYQAEGLVHKKVPVDAIEAIVCNSAAAQSPVEDWIAERGLSINVIVRPAWYF